MIIDHIGLAVSDYARSKLFYETVLSTLDIQFIVEIQGWAGFGKKEDKAEVWFGPDEITQSPMHIAFSANSRKEVDLFYQAAIAAGTTCNGKPSVREIYHPNYYGTFVVDPNEHYIEAVCHRIAG